MKEAVSQLPPNYRHSDIMEKLKVVRLNVTNFDLELVEHKMAAENPDHKSHVLPGKGCL